MTIKVHSRNKPTAFMWPERMRPECWAIQEWLSIPELPDASADRAIVAAGVITQLHAVTDTSEIYNVESGCGNVDDNHKPAPSVAASDIIEFNASARQRIGNTRQEDLVFC